MIFVLASSVYNYFRDYDPSIGRYIESDPIGLLAGTNTYLYVGAYSLICDGTAEHACAYHSLRLRQACNIAIDQPVDNLLNIY